MSSSAQPSPSSSSLPRPTTKPRSPSLSSHRSSRSLLSPKPWGTLSRKSAQSSSLSLVVARGDMDPTRLPSARERLPSVEVRRVGSAGEGEGEGEVRGEVPVVEESIPPSEPAPESADTQSTSTSPPQTQSPEPTPTPAPEITEPGTPLSIDESVPPLPTSSPLPPSRSRFSLALPLLGRAKVPLDVAMRADKVDGKRAEEDRKRVDGVDVHAAGVHEGYLPPSTSQDIQPDPTPTPTSTSTAPAALPAPAPISGPPPSPAQRAADTVSGSSTPLPTFTPPSPPSPPPTSAAPADPALSGEPVLENKGEDNDKLKPDTGAAVTRSGSWWDYVWTPAPSATSIPAVGKEDDAKPPAEGQDIAPPETTNPTPEPPAVDPPPSTQPDQPTTDTDQAAPDPAPATETEAEQPLPEPPHTARSVQSATSGGTSAWYTPWTWYGGGSAPVVAVQGEEGAKKDDGEAGEGAGQGREGEALTEAEEIKRKALARDAATAQDTSTAPTDPSPPPPTLESRAASAPLPSPIPDSIRSLATNPIEKSLTSNLGGWSSFFTSRALGAKRMTEGKKDGEGGEGEGEGMEVVDVPDDVGGGAEVRVVASSAPQGVEKPTADEGKEPEPKPTPEQTKQDPARDKSLTRTGRDRALSKSSASSLKSSSKPSRSGANSPNPRPTQPPNLVLPLFAETFGSPPRSIPLAEEQQAKPGSPAKERPSGTLAKAGRLLGSYWKQSSGSSIKGKGKAQSAPASQPPESIEVRGERDREEERAVEELARRLPRTWAVAEGGGVSVPELAVGSGAGVVAGPGAIGGEGREGVDVLRGAKRAVVIGIHGWFPGTLIKSLAGEPTGTSSKFASMATSALESFAERHGVTWEKVTSCPLEGEGRIGERVQRLYDALTSNEEWMADLRDADVVFVACHSQGSIVSTHLLDRLLSDGHIHTSSSPVSAAEDAIKTLAEGNVPHKRKVQRVVCLALCGIHLGPLRYLGSSSVLRPYFDYVEGAAAKELFEFQNTESAVSKEYVAALGRVLGAEIKMVYVASLNDQVVPIYSGIFTAASHPLILRALYIDGDAYHSTDFLTNLLVLLTRILNAGLPDSGLALHLSEATAGSLSGIGHSTAYEEAGVYDLAVDYLFLTNSGSPLALPHPPLHVSPFSASSEQNDYEIPWRLRDLIAHPLVARLFGPAFADLRDAFPGWHPRTAILRDVKRKLSPIQRLREGRGGGAFGMGGGGGLSRL